MSKEYVQKLRNLDYGSFHSVECEGFRLPFQRRICFRQVFDGVQNKAHYELELIRNPEFNKNTGYNNICWLTKSELKRHIKLARRLFPFTYRVEDSEYEGNASFRVFIDIDQELIYHKYLLTWIRYAYEIPYNFILSDALRLKHTSLRKESVVNLYTLCVDSFNQTPWYYGTGHSMPHKNSMFLKEQVLKTRLTKCSRLNDLFSQEYLAYKTIQFPDFEAPKYLEYWLDDEEFQKRAVTYLDNYKLMTKK